MPRITSATFRLVRFRPAAPALTASVIARHGGAPGRKSWRPLGSRLTKPPGPVPARLHLAGGTAPRAARTKRAGSAWQRRPPSSGPRSRNRDQHGHGPRALHAEAQAREPDPQLGAGRVPGQLALLAG